MSLTTKEQRKNLVKAKLANIIIDKKVAKWNKSAKNSDGKDIDEFPSTLEGDILLETDYDDQGQIKGWISVSPDGFQKVFKDAIEDHLINGTPLADALLASDDVMATIDLDADEDAESVRVALEKGYPVDTEEEIRLAILAARSAGGSGVTSVKIGERGYKKYIDKWILDGDIT